MVILAWAVSIVTNVAVKLDAGPPWGSGLNQGWFDLLSVM